MVTVDEEMDVVNNNVIGNLPMDDKNMSRMERDRKIEELLCKSDNDIFWSGFDHPGLHKRFTYIQADEKYVEVKSM